jgi:hypothetical protein
MGIFSRLFGDKKKNLLEEKCKELLGANTQWATNWYQTVAVRLSLDDATFLVEMDTYLYCLSDYFLEKNCVDNNIRQELLKSFNTKNKYIFSKTVPINYHDELIKRINKRIEDYRNILNNYNDITDDYFEKIMDYQKQRFLEVFAIHNQFVNPKELNKELHEYFREVIKELIRVGIFKNLVDEYFTNKNYKFV